MKARAELNDDVVFHEDGGPYAAKVTAINPDGTLELVTFGRNSIYFQHNVTESYWHCGKDGVWKWSAGGWTHVGPYRNTVT